MNPASAPRVSLLGKTNLDESCQHSLLISALRTCAALQVLATHLRGEFYPSLRTVSEPALWYQALAFLTGFGHLSVVIFFLLSGWLVGGSVLNKLGQPRLLASYAIDRVTRLWIVLIPGFVLTLVLGTVTGSVDPTRVSYAPDDAYSLTTFLGNLFGLQGMAVPRFGGNYALWSLANEIWYYALFPLLLLPIIGKSRFAKAAGPLLAIFIASQLLADISLYFLIWLLGVGFSRVRIVLSRPMRLALVAVLLALAAHLRLSGSIGTLIVATFPEDLLFSLLFLCLLSSLQFPAERSRPGNRIAIALGVLAPFSFTLYVIHYPLLYLIKHLGQPYGISHLSPTDPASMLVYGALFAGIVAFAWLFHLPFEAQTNRLRRFVKRILLEPRDAAYSGAPMRDS